MPIAKRHTANPSPLRRPPLDRSTSRNLGTSTGSPPGTLPSVIRRPSGRASRTTPGVRHPLGWIERGEMHSGTRAARGRADNVSSGAALQAESRVSTDLDAGLRRGDRSRVTRAATGKPPEVEKPPRLSRALAYGSGDASLSSPAPSSTDLALGIAQGTGPFEGGVGTAGPDGSTFWHMLSSSSRPCPARTPVRLPHVHLRGADLDVVKLRALAVAVLLFARPRSGRAYLLSGMVPPRHPAAAPAADAATVRVVGGEAPGDAQGVAVVVPWTDESPWPGYGRRWS